MARAVALNLLKAAALVALLATAFGGIGWLIGFTFADMYRQLRVKDALLGQVSDIRAALKVYQR